MQSDKNLKLKEIVSMLSHENHQTVVQLKNLLNLTTWITSYYLDRTAHVSDTSPDGLSMLELPLSLTVPVT